MNRQVISSVIIAISIVISATFIGQAISKYSDSNRYVTVRGFAEKTVKSDSAMWTISFNYGDDDITSLNMGVLKNQEEILSFLKKQGFTEDEIEIQPMQVYDNYTTSYSSVNDKTKRLVATVNIIINTKKVDLLKESLQKTNILVQQGVILNMPTFRYMFTELNDLKPQLLDEATANALISAESFAKNSGSEIGVIRQASQGLVTISDSNEQSYGYSDIMKNVRVVVTVQYSLHK
jgi:uncharacterized protein